MKFFSVSWNVVRVLIIVVSCFQLGLAHLDSMEAARVLSLKEGPLEYRLSQELVDREIVIDILYRRGGDSWFWVLVLGGAALLPYSSVSRSSSKSE